MVLVEATIGSELHRLSETGFVYDDYWYDNKVIGFDAPQYTVAGPSGGFATVSYGNIQFVPTLFSDIQTQTVIPLVIKYIPDEGAPIEIFRGTGHISGINNTDIVYDLYGADFSEKLLDEADDFNGDTVPLPRAFGTVEYVNPVRLPDRNSKQTWHAGHITSGLQAHDDGVAVPFVENNDGSITLDNIPVGNVTISGTAGQCNLNEIFLWAAERLPETNSLESTRARPAAPTVAHWANSQMTVVDFLSNLSSFFSHCCHVRAGVLHLTDMFYDDASPINLSEYQYFSAPYTFNVPLKSINSEWVRKEAGVWAAGIGQAAGTYIKEHPVTVEHLTEYPYGDEQQVDALVHDVAAVTTALENIARLNDMPNTTLSAPMRDILPEIGQAVLFEDTAKINNTTFKMNVRSIRYDFSSLRVEMSGEGRFL